MARLSSSALNNNGVIGVLKSVNGSIQTVYENNNNGVNETSALNSLLDSSNMTYSSVLNENEYNSVYSYFQHQTGNLNSAKVLAMLIIDACKSFKVSPLVIVEELKKNKSAEFNALIPYINGLRNLTDQMTISAATDNKVSKVSREIRP